jgi:hypothetical protein
MTPLIKDETECDDQFSVSAVPPASLTYQNRKDEISQQLSGGPFRIDHIVTGIDSSQVESSILIGHRPLQCFLETLTILFVCSLSDLNQRLRERLLTVG